MSLKSKALFFVVKNSPQIVIITTGVIVIGTLALLYQDLRTKDSTSFCYAFFAANAIMANCMFSLGRSNVFIERFDKENDQKKIYRSAVLFIVAALIGLTMSAFAYMQLSMPSKITNEYFLKFIYIAISLYMTIGVAFTIGGIVNLALWLKKALYLFVDDLNKNNNI